MTEAALKGFSENMGCRTNTRRIEGYNLHTVKERNLGYNSNWHHRKAKSSVTSF